MELILRILRRVMWYACRLLPIQNNKIVFVSHYGRGYSDNPKYVAEGLLGTGAKMKYVWIANDEKNAGVPEGFITAPMNSFRYIYHMSTAKFWVDNARKYWCLKKKDQKYIQCWHGGFGLKKIEKDAFDRLEPDYQRMALLDASLTDLMVSNSKTLTKLYRDAFWYEKGEILECGLPRNDRLFSYTDEDVKTIKEKLDIPQEKKIALYAPTFRQSKTLSVYDFFKQINAKKVLIVTNRPAIANSWYEDYVKFMGDESGFKFVSDTEALKGKKYKKYCVLCIFLLNRGFAHIR